MATLKKTIDEGNTIIDVREDVIALIREDGAVQINQKNLFAKDDYDYKYRTLRKEDILALAEALKEEK